MKIFSKKYQSVYIVGEKHRDLESNLEQQRGKMKDRETENLKEKQRKIEGERARE